MPCQVYEPHNEIQRSLDDANKKNRQYKEQLDDVTRMLCSTLKFIDNTEVEHHVYKHVDGLISWWENHKKMDKQRELDVYHAAINKLNPEEVEIILRLSKKPNER